MIDRPASMNPLGYSSGLQPPKLGIIKMGSLYLSIMKIIMLIKILSIIFNEFSWDFILTDFQNLTNPTKKHQFASGESLGKQWYSINSNLSRLRKRISTKIIYPPVILHSSWKWPCLIGKPSMSIYKWAIIHSKLLAYIHRLGDVDIAMAIAKVEFPKRSSPL